MSSFIEKLKKRKEAQEQVAAETASPESIDASQKAAKAFEKTVSDEKKKKGQNSNSRDGYSR